MKPGTELGTYVVGNYSRNSKKRGEGEKETKIKMKLGIKVRLKKG